MISPENEEEIFDDMKAIQSLARQGSDTSTKKVGDLRDLHLRIYAITRHWVKKDLHD